MAAPALLSKNKPAPDSMLLVLAVCAGVALWVDLGTFHRYHNSDSLIPTLVSLYRWTPFYWGQDRLGMLIPLLAVPFRHPLTNLLVQVGLSTFAALASMCLLARYVLPQGLWQPAALLSAASFLALAPDWIRFETLAVHQPYGLSLALALGGLCLLEHKQGGASRLRVVASLALLLLAHWVNLSMAVLGPPLVLLRWRLRASRSATPLAPAGLPHPRRGRCFGKQCAEPVRSAVGSALVLLAVATAAGLALKHVAESGVTSLRFTSPQEWPTAWYRFAEAIGEAFTSREWPVFQLATPLVAGALLIGLPKLRQAARPAWRAGLVLVLAALLYACITAGTEHAKQSHYAYRYLIPSILLVQSASAAVAISPLGAVVQRQARMARWITSAGMVGLWVAAVIGFGLPSLTGVRQDIDRQLGQRTADLLAADCTYIAGSYWDVWTSMFHATLVLHERGERRALWGLSNRSLATQAFWSQVPPEKVRVGVPLDDKEADRYLRAYQFPPMVEVGRRRTIVVLQPASSPPTGADRAM